MLLYAVSMWQGVITANLWLLAIRMTNAILSESPEIKHTDNAKAGHIALELFAQTKVAPNPKLWNTFGSLVHVLDNAL